MARGKEASTRELVITDRGACFVQTAFVGASRSAWQHVAVFLPEIFRFCSSKAVQDPCSVRVLKLWVDLHRFDGLGHGSFERLWLCVGVRATVFGL